MRATRSDSMRRCSVEPAVGSPAIATSMRSRTPWMCVWGSRPHVWQRGWRRSVNGAAVRQRGQDRIGSTAGSTDALYRAVESRGGFRYDASMRTWLAVGLTLVLGSGTFAAPAKKGAKPVKVELAPLVT